MGRRGEEWVGNVQGRRSINGRYKIDRGGLEQYRKWRSQELICMTHGHELSGLGFAGGRSGAGQRRIKETKNGMTVII